MTEEKRRVVCPYCSASATVEREIGNAVYRDAGKTRKDAEHVHEQERATCDGHFYVHYSLN